MICFDILDATGVQINGRTVQAHVPKGAGSEVAGGGIAAGVNAHVRGSNPAELHMPTKEGATNEAKQGASEYGDDPGMTTVNIGDGYKLINLKTFRCKGRKYIEVDDHLRLLEIKGNKVTQINKAGGTDLTWRKHLKSQDG